MEVNEDPEENEKLFPDNINEPAAENYSASPAALGIKLQGNETMEVHHHPHLDHKRKKFGEYFTEFLMIFLAVTLGFFAENFRERIVTREKEHHYMESMVQDLKKDTSEVSQVMRIQSILLKEMESALQIPVEKLTNISVQSTFYHHFVYFYSFNILFLQHDKTFMQLKNAGGFGVIKNEAVADSIAELNVYYNQIVKFDGDYYDDYEKKMIDIGAQVMKMSALSDLSDTLSFRSLPNMERITRHDPANLEQLYSWIRNVKACLILYIRNESDYQKKAVRLIDLINTEYHLEK
jgi:hypothetical protein